jgi:hypothetical protein
MMEGEKMESYNKEFLKLKCFSPLNILTSLSFEDTLGGFFLFFSILFLPLFLSFFHAPSLEDLGAFDDISGEKSLLQKLILK